MVRHTLLVSQTGRGKFAPPATIRDPLCTPTNGPATPISSGRSGSDCQSSVMPDSSAGLASSAYPQLANREQAAASKRTSNLDGAKRLMFNGLTSIHQNKMSVTGLSFAYLTRFLWQLQLVIPARTSLLSLALFTEGCIGSLPSSSVRSQLSSGLAADWELDSKCYIL